MIKRAFIPNELRQFRTAEAFCAPDAGRLDNWKPTENALSGLFPEPRSCWRSTPAAAQTKSPISGNGNRYWFVDAVGSIRRVLAR